jgi:hypothetical protein
MRCRDYMRNAVQLCGYSIVLERNFLEKLKGTWRKMVRLNVRISDEILAELRRQSKATGLPVAAIVRYRLERELAREKEQLPTRIKERSRTRTRYW